MKTKINLLFLVICCFFCVPKIATASVEYVKIEKVKQVKRKIVQKVKKENKHFHFASIKLLRFASIPLFISSIVIILLFLIFNLHIVFLVLGVLILILGLIFLMLSFLKPKKI